MHFVPRLTEYHVSSILFDGVKDGLAAKDIKSNNGSICMFNVQKNKNFDFKVHILSSAIKVYCRIVGKFSKITAKRMEDDV